MSELTLKVRQRDELGKNANRRLRNDGQVPAVVYGLERDPISIRVADREIFDLLRKGGDNAVFLLEMEGTDQKRHAMIRDLQVHPITGKMVHIDFQRINMEETVRVAVPIEVVGTPLGVKNEGGMVEFATREVEVECLPNLIPQQLELDISELHLGQHLEAKDLAMPDGVELQEEPSRVIVTVTLARIEMTEAEEEAAELLEAELEEPEVVGRGKEEEEEGEEAEKSEAES